MAVKVDAKFRADFPFGNDGVAEEAADDGATQAVFVSENVAAHSSKAMVGDGSCPVVCVALVLSVGAVEAADGGNTHAVEAGAGFRGITLKIAVQSAVLLRDGEFIARLGEVIHPDVEVASLDEFEQAGTEDFEFLHAFGQVRGEGTLLLFEPGDVGVAEEGDAVWRQREDLINSGCKAIGGLVRQAVNEVDIDAVEAEQPRGSDEIAGDFVGLDTVNGFLDFGMEVLDAHAEAIEAKTTKGFDVSPSGNARIDFDSDFGVGREREMFASEAKEVLDLSGRQIGGSAAAPVKLDNGANAGNAASDASNFFLQGIEVGRRDFVILLNDDVAGAEEAEAFAEGNMHVKRNGRGAAIGVLVDFFEVGRAEGIVPDGSSRVAGVARAGTIIASEEIFADTKLFAHLLKTGSGKRHSSHLSVRAEKGPSAKAVC